MNTFRIANGFEVLSEVIEKILLKSDNENTKDLKLRKPKDKKQSNSMRNSNNVLLECMTNFRNNFNEVNC